MRSSRAAGIFTVYEGVVFGATRRSEGECERTEALKENF
jgi:hypothetical protein